MQANPPEWFVFLVIFGTGMVGFVVMLSINATLRVNTKWSLADALSEESDLPILDANGAPTIGPDGKVITAPRLVASTSRLIALMGLIGILMLYLAFGAIVIYYFGMGQGIPKGLADVQNYLLAGLTLFAPYVVNKFAGVFDGLTPKK